MVNRYKVKEHLHEIAARLLQTQPELALLVSEALNNFSLQQCLCLRHLNATVLNRCVSNINHNVDFNADSSRTA